MMKRGVFKWLLAATCAWPANSQATPSSGPVVDVGYAKYGGYYDDTYGLNVWKSIRYAEPPVGELRWQAPQPPQPVESNGDIIPATQQPPICPQAGAFGTPKIYGFNSGPGNEDCLYLNIYAAPNASSLPVLVWIHGGGYSVFGAAYDPSTWINTNSNAFIVVEIQYRLGAFGYLASPDVQKQGRLNAGLLDMRLALEWVQEHITKFGGDPTRVTIGGESSGAGSVMYQAMAYGGNDSGLFNNIIAASPYTPTIYNYSDSVPTQHYDTFAELAGCGKNSSSLDSNYTVFDCLVAADTVVLQNANGIVSTTQGYFGSFAFLPVLDGTFIRERPSAQLLAGRVSGKRLLIGTNANEGVPLVNPEVNTRSEYNRFISNTFPLFNATDVCRLNSVYKISESKPGNNGVRFDTLGDSGPTALTQSGMATGIQQSVFNLIAETTFHCPALWLAEAYSTDGRQAWKYQYSPTPSYHGADLSAYFPVTTTTTPSASFRHAFQKAWGNFIINNSPVITVVDATGTSANATIPTNGGGNGLIHWPEFSLRDPWQMDFNTTGGNVSLVVVTNDLSYYIATGDGINNNFRLTNALTWEGGRGQRCGFWSSVAPKVPQ